MREQDRDELLKEMERRAREASEPDEPPAIDLVAAADRGALSDAEASAAVDVTLAGYFARHGRPPAFQGGDGQPYSVDVDADQDEEGRWAAFLVFLRWAATGAGIMGHLESGDVAHGATEAEAREAALALSLYDVKAELEAAIARRSASAEA